MSARRGDRTGIDCTEPRTDDRGNAHDAHEAPQSFARHGGNCGGHSPSTLRAPAQRRWPGTKWRLPIQSLVGTVTTPIDLKSRKRNGHSRNTARRPTPGIRGARASCRRRASCSRASRRRGLPNKRHQAVANVLAVARISGQVLSQEPFFVEEPPNESGHERDEHEQPPPRVQRQWHTDQ